MSAIVAVVLLATGCAGLGRAVLDATERFDRLRAEEAPSLADATSVLLSTGLGVWVLSTSTLALGSVGVLSTATVVAVLLGGAGYGVVSWRGSRVRWPTIRDRADRLVVVLIVALALCNLARALCPPTAWDAVAYHLALGKLFAAAGGFVDVATMRAARWPLGLDALYVVSELLGGGAVSGAFAWFLGVVATAAVAALGAMIGGTRAAVAAAALFAGAPVTAFLGGVAYVDAGLAGLVALALVGALRAARSDRQSDLLAAGILVGAAATVKYTALLFPPLVAAVVVVASRRWRPGVLVLVVAGVAALPWYVRTWSLTGNPIWPYANELFDGSDWSPRHAAQLARFERGYGPGTSAVDALFVPWRIVFSPELFDQLPPGPALLALVPLAFVYRRRDVAALVGFSTAAGVAWFFTTQQIRFLVPLLPAYVAAVGAGIAALEGRIVATGARTILGLTLASTLILGLAEARSRLPVLRGTESTATYLEQSMSHHAAVVHINTVLRPELLLLVREVRGYYLDVPYLWGDPLNQAVIDYDRLADPPALAARLAALGVDSVLVNDNEFRGAYYAERTLWLIEATLAQHATLVWRRDGVRVYRLLSGRERPDRDAGGAPDR